MPPAANGNDDTVTPFRNKISEFTDFRVLLNNALRTGDATRRGIVIWFDEDDAIMLEYVGMKRQHVAIAAANLLKDAVE